MTYTVKLAGWPKGVDNIHAPYELPRDTLRDGVNVDILDSGKIRMRKGCTSALPLVGAHSLWSDPRVVTSFYVAGNTLYSLTKDMTSTAVATGLMFGRSVAFIWLNGDVFWSNGVNTGRIRNGVNLPWGIETPAGNATLAPTTGGLPAGTYQVVTTFKNADGEESGAQNTQSITLAATGGISMTNLPRAVSATVTHQCVYATLTNGDVKYKIAQLPIAQTAYTISNIGNPTVALKTIGLAPMPGGGLLAYRGGQLFAANGPYVYYSDPLRYGLYNPSRNFYMYPDDVSVMLAVPEGLYVCADRTYFISAPGTDAAAQAELLPYGAVKGTGVYLHGNTSCAWFSERGQVIGKGGQVEVVTEPRHVPGIMTTGVSFVREQQGLRQIVTVTHQNESSPLEHT